jgi:hypothetical protein
MPETKAQRAPAAKRAAASRSRKVERSEHDATNAVERATELSEDLLQSLEDGARTAIEAVRKFVDTVDQTLPAHDEGPSRREEITDSALEMAQRLVRTQYDFLRKVVASAGNALTKSDDAK